MIFLILNYDRYYKKINKIKTKNFILYSCSKNY